MKNLLPPSAGTESRDPGAPPEPGGSGGQVCADGTGKHQRTGCDLVEIRVGHTGAGDGRGLAGRNLGMKN